MSEQYTYLETSDIITETEMAIVAADEEEAEVAPGTPMRRRELTEILIEAGAIRFKPILLTALAAMIGAAVILTDPIFQGLAISLLFGLASSTALTILVIPAIYVALRSGPRHNPAAYKPAED